MKGRTWANLLSRKRRRRRKITHFSWQKRVLYFLPVISFFLFIILVPASILAFAWVAKSLPSPNKVVRREGFATRIYDRNDKLLYDVFRGAKRTPVKFNDLPDHLKWATIAVEDKNFYSHPGFSFRGIARAVFNIVFHHRLQGGSTLTQQLVKNVLLTPKRTFSRKIKEFILALQIEKKYNKDEILLMYLNEAPYGGTAWGAGAAAEQYFGKSAGDLTLVESAILAGLPQRPSVYSPFAGDIWQERTKTVLRRMRKDGYIDNKEEEKAVANFKQVRFNTDESLFRAPHFVMYLKRILAEKYGEDMVEQGGLKVKTTLDFEFQEQTEKIAEEELEKVAYLNITNGAVIVLDPRNGEILSMVGSKNYFDQQSQGNFNVITQGFRQPGSAIKPVTYATGLKKGYTAATLLMDTRTVFPIVDQKDYIPVNYDGKYRGPLAARYALGNSINVPAVKMLAMVGLKEMLAVASDMGISTLAPTKENLRRLGLSVTLGGGEIKPIELATAYCSFANGGIKKEAGSVLLVKDRNDKVIWRQKPLGEKRVLSPGESFLVSDILSDNNARLITFGEHSGLVVPGRKVAVKTGTTNDKRDNWAVGWTPNILVLVWVGNNDNSPMKKVASGISGATPIWRRVMMAAIDKFGYQEFSIPQEIVSAEIDKISGYRAHDGFPSTMEYFIKGTVPVSEDAVHVKLKVCPRSGKLATPPQVARGEYEEKEFFVFKEEDFFSSDGKNRWQEGVLNWLFEYKKDEPCYHPPTEYCEEGGAIEVTINLPANESTVENNFPVKLKAKGIKKIIEVKVFVDGQEKKVFATKPYEFDLTLPDGLYTVKAVAKDEDGQTGEREAKIGVNLPWNWQPSPTPTPSPIPSPILTPTLTPTLAPTNTPEPTSTESPTPTP